MNKKKLQVKDKDNCALCYHHGEVLRTAKATPFCKNGTACAKRIREDLLAGRVLLVTVRMIFK